MQVENTAAIVTGGASGLGAATARALAAAGASVLRLRPGRVHRQRRRRSTASVTCRSMSPTATRSGGGRTGRRRSGNRCARWSTAQESARRCGSWARRAFTIWRCTAKVIQVNLVGTFNVLALAAEQIATTPPLADGQRGRHHQHRQCRRLRGADRAGGVLLVQGRRRRALPAGRPGSGAVRHPGQHDRPGHRRDTDVGNSFRGVPGGLAAGVPFPQRLARPDEYANWCCF